METQLPYKWVFFVVYLKINLSLSSGTLHPNCQDSTGRPRRDITTILQILNDLLSATRHYQGTPPALAQLRCHTPTPVSPRATTPTSPCPPPSPTVMELPSAPVSPLSSSPTSDRLALSHSRISKPMGTYKTHLHFFCLQTSVPVSHSVGGVASVFVIAMKVGVALNPHSPTEGGVASSSISPKQASLLKH